MTVAQVTVKRNVNLRAEATTSSTVIQLLESGATLTLLSSTKQAGFYHVKTSDGQNRVLWVSRDKRQAIEFS